MYVATRHGGQNIVSPSISNFQSVVKDNFDFAVAGLAAAEYQSDHKGGSKLPKLEAPFVSPCRLAGSHENMDQ